MLHPPGVHITAGHYNTINAKEDQIASDNKAGGKQRYTWPDDHQTAQDNSQNIYGHGEIIVKFSNQADHWKMCQPGYSVCDEPYRKEKSHDQRSCIWIHQQH